MQSETNRVMSSEWQNAYSACEQRHRVLMELTEARSRMSHASHRFREKNSQLEAAAQEYRSVGSINSFM